MTFKNAGIWREIQCKKRRMMKGLMKKCKAQVAADVPVGCPRITFARDGERHLSMLPIFPKALRERDPHRASLAQCCQPDLLLTTLGEVRVEFRDRPPNPLILGVPGGVVGQKLDPFDAGMSAQ